MQKLYTPKEVAELLGYSINTVNTYISRGTIKAVKVLGSNRVTEEEIKRLIEPSDK